MAKIERDEVVSMLAREPDGSITVIRVPLSEAQELFATNAATLLVRVGKTWAEDLKSDQRLSSVVASLSSVLDGIKHLKPDLYAKARARYTKVAGILDGVGKSEQAADEGEGLAN